MKVHKGTILWGHIIVGILSTRGFGEMMSFEETHSLLLPSKRSMVLVNVMLALVNVLLALVKVNQDLVVGTGI